MKKLIRRKAPQVCMIAISLIMIITTVSCSRLEESIVSGVLGILGNKNPDESTDETDINEPSSHDEFANLDNSADSANSDGSGPDGRTEIRVSTTEEFIRAIGSNRTIILDEGDYVLPNDDGLSVQSSLEHWEFDPLFGNPNVVYEQTNGYAGLTIRGVENMRIEGEPVSFGRITAFLISPTQFLDCLIFRDCKNIELAYIYLSAGSEEDFNVGNILAFQDCADVSLTGVAICGEYLKGGLRLDNVSNFKAETSYFGRTMWGIMECNDVQNAEFFDCRIMDNEGSVRITDSEDITFDECLFTNNAGEEYIKNSSLPMFYCTSGKGIRIVRCEFINNTYVPLDEGGIISYQSLILDESNLFEHIPDLFLFDKYGRVTAPTPIQNDTEETLPLPDPVAWFDEGYALMIMGEIDHPAEGLTFMVDGMTMVETDDYKEEALAVRAYFDMEDHIATMAWYYVGVCSGRVWEYSVEYDYLTEITFTPEAYG